MKLDLSGRIWKPRHSAFPLLNIALELDISPAHFSSIKPFVFFFAHRASQFVSLLSVYVCFCVGPCAATPGQSIFLLSIRHWFPVWLHQTNTRFCLLLYTHTHTRTDAHNASVSSQQSVNAACLWINGLYEQTSTLEMENGPFREAEHIT